MRYSQARQGRIFVVRLEDGDVVHEQIEALAAREGVRAAVLVAVGGLDRGSRLVVGPRNGRAAVIEPMGYLIDNVHEIVGTGTLFPDDEGQPVLHMHMACGRKGNTVTGCIRTGVRVWHVLEVIMFELLDSTGVRIFDEDVGFKLLSP